jgi:hypothetical protein
VTASLADTVRDVALSLDPDMTAAASRWDVRVGQDWMGNPAVFVTLVFRDDAIGKVWRRREDYRRALRDRLFELLPEDYYPFIGFSAESVALDPDKVASS